MKPEKQINLDGYLSDLTQKMYYDQKRKEEESISNKNEYSDFEIDLYNMGRI